VSVLRPASQVGPMHEATGMGLDLTEFDIYLF